MADVDLGSDSGHKKGGVKKAKKLSTRVDLTPMVDLGFLLLTFFVFSSTLSQPSTMKMNLPDEHSETQDKNEAKATGVLTLALGKNNNIYYFVGQLAADGSNVKKTDFAHLREVIVNQKNITPPDDFVVIISAGDESTYDNVVTVLDEMTINDVQAYNLQSISPDAAQYLKTHDN